MVYTLYFGEENWSSKCWYLGNLCGNAERT